MRFRCRPFRGPKCSSPRGNTVVTLSGSSSAVLGLALRQGYLLLSGTGCLARNNLVGMTATGDSSADNSSAAYGIEFAGSNSTVRNNFVTVNNSGIRTQDGGTGSLVTLNEVARPTSGHTNTFDGILLVGTVSSIQVTANLTREQRGGGIEVGFGGGASASNITVTNNTVRNNGFATGGSGAASTEPIGMAAYDYAGSNVVFSRNLIRDNAGAGIAGHERQRHDDHAEQLQHQRRPEHRSRSAEHRSERPRRAAGRDDQRQRRSRHRPERPAQLSRSSSRRAWSAPSSRSAASRGPAAPSSCTSRRRIRRASAKGSPIWARSPKAPPADLDATTGTYGPANINGVAQGTDNTNRFSFRITVPGGVAHRHAR